MDNRRASKPMDARRSAGPVAAARLAAQRLSGPPAADVLEATRHLLAVQAQDPRGVRLALRARVSGGHASALDRALTNERSVVITWANRGTLHLIAAEDEPLLHALSTPQLRRTSARRLAQEGVSEAARERGIRAMVKALGDNGPMTRAQLRGVLEREDVPTAGQALVHLLFRATLDGLIVRGPLIGKDHAFALVADWLGERPQLDREQALGELALRYLAGHGPANEYDLAKWAHLSLRDARAGVHRIAPRLARWPGGLVGLIRADTHALPAPRLLGPFDPLLLGWRSRDWVLEEEPEIIAANGIIKAVVLVRGRVAGTWSLAGGQVELRLWSEQSRATLTALKREAASVEAYVRPAGS